MLLSQNTLAYDIYRWNQIGTNYIGSLNYQGAKISQTESSQALEQSFSGVVDANSKMFTTLQSEVKSLIDSKARHISEYRGATVTVGSNLGIKMIGAGNSSNIDVALPPISAQLFFKKEALFGLIEAQCTVNFELPNSTITGNLDMASGAVNNIDIHSDGKASVDCQDNIPLIGGLIADVLDHFAESAIKPILNDINTPGGVPLSRQNFLGVNQLLNSSKFVVAGQNYGAFLMQDLEYFVDNTEVDIEINNIQRLLPDRGGPGVAMAHADSIQTIASISFPKINIQLDVQVQQIYGTIGRWVAGDEP